MSIQRIKSGVIADSAVTAAKLDDSTSQLFGFRNRIINGDFRINQRGWTSAAVTDAYTVDRWKVVEQTDGAITAEQSTDAPAGFVNSLKITVTSTDTSLGATQFARVQQIIEGTNIADLAFGTSSAKTITISFWVKSSLTGTFSAAIRAVDDNRSYPFTYTISSANTWEYKSKSIPGDTGGTWPKGTGGGMSLFLTLCSGSDFDAPANAWETTGASAAEGGVNVLGTNGATIQWTGVQLEVGSVATPFERRPFGAELALCYRYFQTYPQVEQIAFGGRVSDTAGLQGPFWYFPGGEMRGNPTVAYTDGAGNSARVAIQSPPNNNFSQTNIGGGIYTLTNKYLNFKSYNTTVGLSEGQVGLLRASSLTLTSEL